MTRRSLADLAKLLFARSDKARSRTPTGRKLLIAVLGKVSMRQLRPREPPGIGCTLRIRRRCRMASAQWRDAAGIRRAAGIARQHADDVFQSHFFNDRLDNDRRPHGCSNGLSRGNLHEDKRSGRFTEGSREESATGFASMRKVDSGSWMSSQSNRRLRGVATKTERPFSRIETRLKTLVALPRCCSTRRAIRYDGNVFIIIIKFVLFIFFGFLSHRSSSSFYYYHHYYRTSSNFRTF